MQRLLCILLLFVACRQGYSQTPFVYDDYFYYRNHQYLQTSSILLTGATLKIASGDAAAAVRLIEQAAEKMYDTGFITSRSSFGFITKTKGWTHIKQTVNAFGM